MCSNLTERKIEEIRFSDENPTMVGKTAFNNIIEQIQSSNLNFQLQMSPFSASISLKKSLIKDKFGNILFPPTHLHQTHANVTHDTKPDNSLPLSENYGLKQEIKDLESVNKTSQDTIKLLEQKISKVEAAALKLFEEKKVEVATLKKSLNNSNMEIERFNKDVKANNKLIKDKDKEIFRLEQKNENMTDNLKKSKTEISSLKSEQSKLIRKNKVHAKVSKSVSTNTILLEELCPPFTMSPNYPKISLSNSQMIPSTPCTAVCQTVSCDSNLNNSSPSKTLDMNRNNIAITTQVKETINILNVRDPEVRKNPNLLGCHHSPQCYSREPFPPPLGPLTQKQVNLDEEIEKSENYSEALLKTVINFVDLETNASIDDTIIKLKAVRKVLDPDSDLEGHVSPFDILIDLAKNTKDAIESMKNKNLEENESVDYYEEDDDLPRHYYGDEGEILFYDD